MKTELQFRNTLEWLTAPHNWSRWHKVQREDGQLVSWHYGQTQLFTRSEIDTIKQEMADMNDGREIEFREICPQPTLTPNLA